MHVAETSEDFCFPSDINIHRLFDISKEKLLETEHCLQLVCIRSDWLLELSDIEEQIKKVKYTSDKNSAVLTNVATIADAIIPTRFTPPYFCW